MVISEKYVPAKGDVVWLEFSPQVGHEQAGRRPALCLSPREYNKKVGLAIFCPITSQVKGYPFEVFLTDSVEINGVILADQVKNFDWKTRSASFICKIPDEVLSEVFGKIRTLL